MFTIQPGRTKEAAQEILGRKFTGVVNTDRYNAYHWVDESRRQLCWAHLKREFQAIKERGKKSAELGEGLLSEVSKLFEHWYELREDRIDWPAFQAAMNPLSSESVNCCALESNAIRKKPSGLAETFSSWRDRSGRL